MQVVYNGPFRAVVFADGTEAVRGKPVEVSDDAVLGSDWSVVAAKKADGAKPRSKSTTKATPADNKEA